MWSNILRPRRNLTYRYQTKWAIVTGASDGIGEAICHQLAKSGLNIILVSRTINKLQKVAIDLVTKYGVKTRIVQYDFSNLNSEEETKKLITKLRESIAMNDVGLLVNNVGLAWAGKFHEIPLAKMFNILHVNCAS